MTVGSGAHAGTTPMAVARATCVRLGKEDNALVTTVRVEIKRYSQPDHELLGSWDMHAVPQMSDVLVVAGHQVHHRVWYPEESRAVLVVTRR
jgi:hypothetical protein